MADEPKQKDPATMSSKELEAYIATRETQHRDEMKELRCLKRLREAKGQ